MVTKEEIADKLKINGKYWIAFTGDSITSCEWVHPNWREIVEYVLQNEMTIYLNNWKMSEWGIKGFNFGYDGATTNDILNKVELIKIISPDLVIGIMGGNDELFDIGVSEHIQNIEKIISNLKTKVVWCNSTFSGSPSKNKKYESYANGVIKITGDENIQIIDMFSIYKDFPLEKIYTFRSEEIPLEGLNEGDPDLMHPNQLGNAYIAKVILKDVFGIKFDPEKYWKETLKGEKLPGY